MLAVESQVRADGNEAFVRLADADSGQAIEVVARVAGLHLGPGRHDIIATISHQGQPHIRVEGPLDRVSAQFDVAPNTSVEGNLARLQVREAHLRTILAALLDTDIPAQAEDALANDPETPVTLVCCALADLRVLMRAIRALQEL